MTARELSGHLGLPRATAYRLLNLLVADEYLVRTTDLSGFALGAKVAQLAEAVSPVACRPPPVSSSRKPGPPCVRVCTSSGSRARAS